MRPSAYAYNIEVQCSKVTTQFLNRFSPLIKGCQLVVLSDFFLHFMQERNDAASGITEG